MPAKFCPACGGALAGNVTPTGECAACGHDLIARPAPAGWNRGDRDLREVARRQRTLLWFFLAYLGLIAVQFSLNLNVQTASAQAGLAKMSMLAHFAFSIVAAICVLRLAKSLAFTTVTVVLVFIGALLPCLNLLVILGVNATATGALTAAGLRVSLMGVTDAQVVQKLGGNRCRKCGYMLVGNASGVCPECGTVIGGPS